MTTTTRLIADNHDGNSVEAYRISDGVCYFCAADDAGVPAEEAISKTYFSDHDLRSVADSDHVCWACAYCMDHRDVKNGHWIATPAIFEPVSTGGLHDTLQSVTAGAYETPIAVHLSENPIRSEHAYLWTPVNETSDRLTLSYSKSVVTMDWAEFWQLFEDVETLRRHGFRGDEIMSGSATVHSIRSVGAGRYREIDRRIDAFRGSTMMDIAWTASRSGDDQ